MSDLRHELDQLPEPDPEAIDRVWTRFQTTRARQPVRSRARTVGLAAAAVLTAGLAGAWLATPEAPRELALSASVTPATQRWSDEVSFELLGAGTVRGTSRDVAVDWTRGSLRAEVEPHTDTSLVIRTEEAQVSVVGTVFSVERDALGTAVGVERGRVAVRCDDGWRGELGAKEAHTCLPVTAAGLLARTDALLEAGGDDRVDATIARALPLAEGPVRGELLVRRMKRRAAAGDVDGALEDAEAYLASPSGRSRDVQRFAAWLALDQRGCASAEGWLDALHEAGSAEDSVLLAECVASTEPDRARTLLRGALEGLDDTWASRAHALLTRLEER